MIHALERFAERDQALRLGLNSGPPHDHGGGRDSRDEIPAALCFAVDISCVAQLCSSTALAVPVTYSVTVIVLNGRSIMAGEVTSSLDTVRASADDLIGRVASLSRQALDFASNHRE
jgi:hypothetical protein